MLPFAKLIPNFRTGCCEINPPFKSYIRTRLDTDGDNTSCFSDEHASKSIDGHDTLCARQDQASQREAKLLSSIQACKTRAVLTAEQAAQIFQIKLSGQHGVAAKRSQGPHCARIVARLFGVSDKAVRDIWNGRTWLRETMHLDPARAALAAARLRPPGRPRNTDAKAAVLSKSAACALLRHKPPVPSATTTWPESHGPAVAKTLRGLRTAAGETESLPAAEFHAAAAIWVPAAASAAEPLPESSRADDPFHDDWGYWPDRDADMSFATGD